MEGDAGANWRARRKILLEKRRITHDVVYERGRRASTYTEHSHRFIPALDRNKCEAGEPLKFSNHGLCQSRSSKSVAAHTICRMICARDANAYNLIEVSQEAWRHRISTATRRPHCAEELHIDDFVECVLYRKH